MCSSFFKTVYQYPCLLSSVYLKITFFFLFSLLLSSLLVCLYISIYIYRFFTVCFRWNLPRACCSLLCSFFLQTFLVGTVIVIIIVNGMYKYYNIWIVIIPTVVVVIIHSWVQRPLNTFLWNTNYGWNGYSVFLNFGYPAGYQIEYFRISGFWPDINRIWTPGYPVSGRISYSVFGLPNFWFPTGYQIQYLASWISGFRPVIKFSIWPSEYSVSGQISHSVLSLTDIQFTARYQIRIWPPGYSVSRLISNSASGFCPLSGRICGDRIFYQPDTRFIPSYCW